MLLGGSVREMFYFVFKGHPFLLSGCSAHLPNDGVCAFVIIKILGGSYMFVKPEELIPGCILIEEVKGKTNRPLIPKNTMLTEKHITVLQKYLVERVNISSKLEEGEPFIPKSLHKSENSQPLEVYDKEKKIDMSFKDHYQQVVVRYKMVFERWQNGVAVDMLSVRKLFIPLLERIDEIGSAVYTLYHYATKQDYFYHHSVTVGILSAFLGKKMGYEKREWLQIGLAGLLSDCGMARIDPDLVKKNSSLTRTELDEIKKHPMYSYRMVESLRMITQPVKLAVLQHHERIDGSGYPLGLSWGKIHMYARIVAVSDRYHAMTSDRLYREKQSPYHVIEEIQKDQYTKLDPQVVNTFIGALSDFSIGTRVRLSDDQIGEIVFIDVKQPSQPMIRIENSGEVVSLQNRPALFIDEILINDSN